VNLWTLIQTLSNSVAYVLQNILLRTIYSRKVSKFSKPDWKNGALLFKVHPLPRFDDVHFISYIIVSECHDFHPGREAAYINRQLCNAILFVYHLVRSFAHLTYVIDDLNCPKD
jgi:hypothetical protein